MSAKIYQKDDARVIKEGDNYYIEEWSEKYGEWIEHVDGCTQDREVAIRVAKDLAEHPTAH